VKECKVNGETHAMMMPSIRICHYLRGKWILAQKLRIPKIKFPKHMKLKKKEYQTVDTLSLLKMGNKIPM
jgi:hypothetical protein